MTCIAKTTIYLSQDFESEITPSCLKKSVHFCEWVEVIEIPIITHCFPPKSVHFCEWVDVIEFNNNLIEEEKQDEVEKYEEENVNEDNCSIAVPPKNCYHQRNVKKNITKIDGKSGCCQTTFKSAISVGLLHNLTQKASTKKYNEINHINRIITDGQNYKSSISVASAA